MRYKMSKENETSRTTRHGNDFIADVRRSSFHKPKKQHYRPKVIVQIGEL
jgi:hypothetical protein